MKKVAHDTDLVHYQMNAKDKENITYIVKTLRENISEMSDRLDGDAASPEFTVVTK